VSDEGLSGESKPSNLSQHPHSTYLSPTLSTPAGPQQGKDTIWEDSYRDCSVCPTKVLTDLRRIYFIIFFILKKIE
jgi:hypothetical protein